MKTFIKQFPFIRVFVLAWCLALSIMGYYNSKLTQELSRAVTTNEQTTQVTVLQTKVADLSEQIYSLQTNFSITSKQSAEAQQKTDERNQAVDQRLSQIVQQSEVIAITNQLQLHQEILQELQDAEAVRNRAPAAITVPSSTTRAATKQVPASPPFKIIGAELRGDEQIIAIMPAGKNSIASVQLMRVGQQVGNWTLQSIEGQNTTFKAGNSTHRIPIPQ